MSPPGGILGPVATDGRGQPLQIKRALIADLHHDPANVRLHDERNLSAISASLKTFGQVEPLVVQKGTNKVIGGNGRLTAMKAMGLAECDVVEIEADNVSATALSIALNRSAELASWADAELAETLRALQGEDFNLDAIGFSESEIDALCEKLGDEILGPEADGKEYDESVEDDVKYCECPSCGHRWPA